MRKVDEAGKERHCVFIALWEACLKILICRVWVPIVEEGRYDAIIVEQRRDLIVRVRGDAICRFRGGRSRRDVVKRILAVMVAAGGRRVESTGYTAGNTATLPCVLLCPHRDAVLAQEATILASFALWPSLRALHLGGRAAITGISQRGRSSHEMTMKRVVGFHLSRPCLDA